MVSSSLKSVCEPHFPFTGLFQYEELEEPAFRAELKHIRMSGLYIIACDPGINLIDSRSVDFVQKATLTSPHQAGMQTSFVF